ncbi:MAG: sodium:alanine symporter family protein [Clostridia bacterium]|nr:sodium:alanine symporter family protein [Clostridia bacterium]
MDFLNLLPILITAVGAYFLFKLRFFIFTNPKGIIKKLGSDCVSSASSLSLALAGTLGVGNIVGVAVGISVGGAGSVFWLLVSAVFASVIKFAEVILTADRGAGLGMIGAVGASFGVLSRPLSLVYAALVILLSFSMGSMLQSASIGQSTEYVLNFPPVFTALVLLLLLVFAVFFFSGKIERITVVLIPVATAVYVFLCLSAILLNLERLPSVIFNIFRCAFDFESGVG